MYIIAEAALGYHGKKEIAKLLVRGSATGEADAVKFQVMYADDICVPPYQYRDLFKSMEMSLEDWQEVRELAKSLKLDFVADIFGDRGLEVAQAINADAIKIHTTIFNDHALLKNIFKLNKKIYLSTGGISIEDINTFLKRYSRENVTILFGYQAEPTPIEKNNLFKIPYIQKETGCPVGFMDHENGESEYKNALSLFALGMGVRVFEKHITLDRSIKLENYISSITPTEFKAYTQALRKIVLAYGDDREAFLSPEEIAYRAKAMKKVVAKKAIAQGAVVREEDVYMRRGDQASTLYKAELVVGHKLTVAVEPGTIISENMVAP